MSDIKSLAVFCGSRRGARPAYTEAALALGDLMAERGITLVYGGGRIGLMGVMADRVLDKGGRVIGVIPGFLEDLEVGHQRVSELIRVGSMHERKTVMFEKSDGFVVLPGGLGTMDEGIEIITWKQLRLHQKPIVILNTDGYWQPLVEIWERVITEGFAHDKMRDLFRVVPTVEGILPAMAEQGPPDPAVLNSHL